MQDRPKILVVDDDQEMLDLYSDIIRQLPSQPEVAMATSGPRALAMLEAEPFSLLVCDLNMPKMDGLQVLSIVRSKYPELRTVVLTAVVDEQFRSRVYGLGVDLFWQKPGSGDEIKQFLECVESLLGRENHGGFRGVQSKSLVDLIQLECISHNSTVLKIVNGAISGRIWILQGEVIDAETEGLTGQRAFYRILAWKSGHFESLPPEPERPRTILNSYQGLLLESAQAQDEALSQGQSEPATEQEQGVQLAPLTRCEGVEFALVLKSAETTGFESRGLENPQPVADWSREAMARFRELGERLQGGPLQQLEGYGPNRHIALARHTDLDFCVGWNRHCDKRDISESMKKVLALWVC